MAIILPRRFTSQPQYAAQIDRSNSLAVGLLDAYIPASGRASPIGGITPVMGMAGTGFRATSVTDYYQASVGRILAGSAQYTVIAAFSTIQTAISPGLPLYCERAPSGNDILKLECLSVDNFALLTLRDDAGTLIQIKNAVAVNDGKFHVAAGVQYSASDHRLFVDGFEANSSATTLSNSYTDAIESRIGSDPASGLSVFNDPIYFVGLWNRALSPQEIAEVSSNPYPWALFKAPVLRLVEPASASSGGVGTASGASTVSGVGASDNAQPGSAAGTSAVSGVGSSDANSVASSSGTSTVSGIGAADFNAVGSSSGSATVDGVGTSSTGSSGSASGTCSVSGVGASAAASNGVANGVASVSGIGVSEALSTGTTSGTSTVSGVGDSVQAGSAVGSASGASTVSGVGASVVASVGSASGDCSVYGVGAKAGGEVETFSGGYLYDESRESHAERKKKQRIKFGIEEEKPDLPDGLERFEISDLAEKTPVAPTTSKQRIPARQQKKLAEQEAENAELKMLLQLEVEREEETILRFLMEL